MNGEQYLKRSAKECGFTPQEAVDNLLDEIRKRDQLIRDLAMLLKRAFMSKRLSTKMGLQIWDFLCRKHL